MGLNEVKTEGFIPCRPDALVPHLFGLLTDAAWFTLAFVRTGWGVGRVSKRSQRLNRLKEGEPQRVHSY